MFHRTVTEAFSDIPRVHTYLDDIPVSGSTEEEHDTRLSAVLDRCRQITLKLNLSRCQFKKSELKYLAYILTSEGQQTISNPNHKGRSGKATRTLLKFCPDLVETAKPIQQLAQKEVPWSWDAIHDDSLMKLKTLVTQAPVLKLFDTKVQTTLTVDASSYGLGAALLQEGHPIKYASKTLSVTQKKYAQIKEMLAVQFGLGRFYQYTYGQNRDRSQAATGHSQENTG